MGKIARIKKEAATKNETLMDYYNEKLHYNCLQELLTLRLMILGN